MRQHIRRHALGRGFWLVLLVVSTTVASARATLTLPAIINDNMVLQRDMPILIWGWADAGRKVTVTFAGQAASATAGKNGKWMVRLPAQKANAKPQTMTIQAGKEIRILGNILLGEVWLASGQSNMELPVAASNNAPQEIAAAKHPNLRLFTVARKTAALPEDNVSGVWRPCTPKTAPGFSAVAYFFGRDLLKNVKVPVGLINSSWGGTPIEAWSNKLAFDVVGRGKDIERSRQLTQMARQNYPKAIRKYLLDLIAWEKGANCYDYHNDGFALGWANPGNEPKEWKDAKGHQAIDFIGAIWYRRVVDIPAAWVGKELVLELGVIDDYDTTYMNGLEIGKTDKSVLSYWTHPRVYRVPVHCAKPGKNLISVRVFNNYYTGRFPGAGKLYATRQSTKPISLAGGWQYRIEREQSVRKTLQAKPTPPLITMHSGLPCVLYNGMIHPLVPYAIRGAIWYQGEANAGNAAAYRALFPAMIQGWRKAWGQDFAFGFVQLANFMKRMPTPTDTGWAQLREAQTMTLAVPNTGMAVIIDIGDEKDIHPRNKQDVGKRLALWARAKTYGQKIPYSGPIYKGMKVEGKKIRVSFDHVNGGLVAKDNKPLVGFAIADSDGKFVWANAKIDGKSVLVWSEKIAKPAAVRYAWANNPACNLYNKAGLPASPFRTDTPK